MWHQGTRMELNQYYTDAQYSDVLVSNLTSNGPNAALDIGFGTGNLLYAVRRRWKSANLYGVDIDECNVTLAKHKRDIKALLSDGFDPTLPNKILDEFGNVDLLVSNPPFFSRDVDSDIVKILKESKITDAISTRAKRVPAEIVFLAQNLRLLSSGQEMGIILPAGIISGERWKNLRDLLSRRYTVSKVIQLPQHIFQGTDAQTFALFISSSAPNKNYDIELCRGNGSLFISNDTFINRADYIYYAEKSHRKYNGLSDSDFEIFRGKESFKSLNMRIKPFVHTTNLPTSPNVLHLDNGDFDVLNDVASEGDIVIARVGSRCIARTALIGSGQVKVSDCVIVVRPHTEVARTAIWSILSDEKSLFRLKNKAMGVGAKYLTHSSLREFLIQG